MANNDIENRELRQHFPFIRAPIRPWHLIPLVGAVQWIIKERGLMNQVPEGTKTPDGGKLALLTTLAVNTWPEPETKRERVEHMKTQAIHGFMLAYHGFVSPVVILKIVETLADRLR